MGRELFFKAFPLCKCFYVNYGHESQKRAQLMSDTIFKQDVQRNYNIV